MALSYDDLLIEITEDRPASGMWHCGPNAAWVAVTHIPTMISARAYDRHHRLARERAIACVELMVADCRDAECQFPERVAQEDTPNDR